MADVLDRPDIVEAPHADEIFRPAPAEPDTSVRDLRALGMDMMQATTDELAVGVIERLCLRLADVADDLAVTRIMLSESQTIAYERHVRIVRLEQRVADLLELARGAR